MNNNGSCNVNGSAGGEFIPRLMRTDKKEELRVQKLLAAEKVRQKKAENAEMQMSRMTFKR